jgi:hypothetical protein
MFAVDDAINEAIWADSPALQRSVQAPDTLAAPGSVGAQQAMIDAHTVLPWVPDILGMHWRDPDAVIVIGSAYAGFIREFSGRIRTMPLAEYRRALDWHDFQNRFFRYVVTDDPNYYEPVMRLAGDRQRMALFDLCRASFVERGAGTVTRKDNSGDRIVRKASALFSAYVDAQDHWTWERIKLSQARRIVALGTIAEHGTLRLFARRAMTITCGERVHVLPRKTESRWAEAYADVTRKLGHWLADKSWWTIRGVVDGKLREWRLLPASHPSARSSDVGYARISSILAAMR